MRVVIDPDNGYLSTQPKATQDFVERKLLKAQTAGDIRLCFRGEHWAEPTTANRLDLVNHSSPVTGRKTSRLLRLGAESSDSSLDSARRHRSAWPVNRSYRCTCSLHRMDLEQENGKVNHG